MNRTWKRLIPLAALAAAMAGCSPEAGESDIRLSSDPPPLIQVQLAPVVRSDVSAVLEQVGSLIPRRRSVIVSEVDGDISEISPPSHNPVLLETDDVPGYCVIAALYMEHSHVQHLRHDWVDLTWHDTRARLYWGQLDLIQTCIWPRGQQSNIVGDTR